MIINSYHADNYFYIIDTKVFYVSNIVNCNASEVGCF